MLWALIVIPLAVGATLLLTGPRANPHAAPAALATAALTLAGSITVALTHPSASAPFVAGATFGLHVDGLSATLVVTITTVLLLVLLFATGEIGPDQPRARFFGLMLLFAGSMLVTVTATTLVSLLMAWEIMGATSYALIGFRWRETRPPNSGTIAFLTTRTGDLGLYLAAGAALAGGTGGLTLDRLATLPDGWRDVVAAGVTLAALGKSAQLPFSFWLSRAMDGPSSVSALLHSATMVAAGAYLLLRLHPLLSSTAWAATLIAWLGATTALALGAVALTQSDLKQLLAASTCAQVGFMLLAAGTGGVTAGTAQLVTHALTKSLLFLAAGAWLATLGTQQLTGLRGAARHHPLTGITFTIGAATLAGIPPLPLWTTKDHILAATLPETPALYLLGSAAAALSAGYAARAVTVIWSAPSPDTARPETRHIPSPQRITLPALAVATTALSVLAAPALWSAFTNVISTGTHPTPTWWEQLLSAAIAITAAGAVTTALRLRGDLPAPPRLTEWLGLETLAHTAVAAPTAHTAGTLAHFDDHTLDGGVRATAALGTTLAHTTATRLEPATDAVVGAIARDTRELGRLARRPQTGQLHHYYAQTVVALAIVALLLTLL
ncbi:NADH-quinone oxidoreductase subunit 5 family protein [Saccharomonospora xinjiangensis]|uniref:NADH:ubiquinone oxidoreductase subunit 5 (Chain L)/multisubunit Na+/H+ antiporter, MnhA subunit n=1 Tax=Saccharomonospora xinjiangensis XJ-54 TaxID=882086 RepID=I0V8Q2_9PSEU|nr:proton-conducting transporter membrane subunit [Saccharomonospora xinjiangensis]EID56505.1 NADH:ubiquinone oxidoreductase subunit 5 (chain L)/multisubunit Na+/H+ antiporter, MnhA subunit [Saccharomonospora xinjiangensis XJ-54]